MIALEGGNHTFLHPSLARQCLRSPPEHSCSLPPTASLRHRRGTAVSSSSSLLAWRPLAKLAAKSRGRAVRCAASGDPPAKALRKILESPGIHQGPACFDALSAKLVERAGFEFCFMSGFSVSAARLGLPDVGLISYGEMVDQGHQITQAVSIPVIGDGDNGYGNHMNVKRTVKGFIRAGFAGIILEDQVAPKACGHTQGRKVVSREESVMRIKAAIDAREESGSDIVIVARTDSRQAVSLNEAFWRSRAFADAGADVLFIDALASREEMKAFCDISPLLPKMANMLEGGGKTPILNPVELEDIGFKIVSYPLSLIGVSIQAMQASPKYDIVFLGQRHYGAALVAAVNEGSAWVQNGWSAWDQNALRIYFWDALTAIRSGRVPSPGSLPSFDEIKEIIGFNDYYAEEKRYSTGLSQPSPGRGYSSASSNTYTAQSTAQVDDEPRPRGPQYPLVEVLQNTSSYGSRDRFSGIWSRTLRIKVTGRDGIEKLDVRIPAGFLEGVTKIIPGLVGVNIMDMLEDAAEDVYNGSQKGKMLLDLNDAMGDRIQVFVE